MFQFFFFTSGLIFLLLYTTRTYIHIKETTHSLKVDLKSKNNKTWVVLETLTHGCLSWRTIKKSCKKEISASSVKAWRNCLLKNRMCSQSQLLSQFVETFMGNSSISLSCSVKAAKSLKAITYLSAISSIEVIIASKQLSISCVLNSNILRILRCFEAITRHDKSHRHMDFTMKFQENTAIPVPGRCSWRSSTTSRYLRSLKTKYYACTEDSHLIWRHWIKFARLTDTWKFLSKVLTVI